MAKKAVNSTPDFSLKVNGVEGFCPPGEVWATEKIIEKKIPVIACEGPCIRGDIARLAANIIAEEEPYARACYQELIGVPYSTMARWAKEAEKTVVIDGCFLTCVGRILKNVLDEKKIDHFDALPLYRQYNDVFSMDDVPEAERKQVAREVADKILVTLQKEG